MSGPARLHVVQIWSKSSRATGGPARHLFNLQQPHQQTMIITIEFKEHVTLCAVCTTCALKQTRMG